MLYQFNMFKELSLEARRNDDFLTKAGIVVLDRIFGKYRAWPAKPSDILCHHLQMHITLLFSETYTKWLQHWQKMSISSRVFHGINFSCPSVRMQSRIHLFCAWNWIEYQLKVWNEHIYEIKNSKGMVWFYIFGQFKNAFQQILHMHVFDVRLFSMRQRHSVFSFLLYCVKFNSVFHPHFMTPHEICVTYVHDIVVKWERPLYFNVESCPVNSSLDFV